LPCTGELLGTIEPGRVADLVLLRADPSVDIHNTQQIQAVVSNGRFFDRAALDALLASAAAGIASFPA
jgi:imidazolonepropionase-like amidohydrolase